MENRHLRVGDVVEVLRPEEIRKTLDSDGSLDSLPFMPEMAELCGRRFRVSRRMVKTCLDINGGVPRAFPGEDVVQLEDQRCSGAHHDGCDRQCRMFWKEAWLRKVAENEDRPEDVCESHEIDALCRQLVTISPQGDYVCQSSRLGEATQPLPRWRRLFKSARDVQVGNLTIIEMMRVLLATTFWKGHAKLFGVHPVGQCRRTPDAALELQPGELVEVKSFEEILATLDRNGCNRGLLFEGAMRDLCGKRFRVLRRLDKMVREDNGKLINLRNTVILDNVVCQCRLVLGGCGRGEPSYWREIWLKRASVESTKPNVGEVHDGHLALKSKGQRTRVSPELKSTT